MDQEPDNGAIVDPTHGFVVSWTVVNGGRTTWPNMNWRRVGGDRLSASWQAAVPLIGPGEATTLSIGVGSPPVEVDLSEIWELADAVDTVLHVEFHYTTTPRAVRLLRLAPARAQRVTPQQEGEFILTLRNATDEPLEGATVGVESDDRLAISSVSELTTMEPTAVAVVHIAFAAPLAPGRYEARVRLIDHAGKSVAILGGALPRRTIALTIDVEDDTLAEVTSCSVPDGTFIPPGMPFLQACSVTNAGRTSWAPGWYVEGVGSTVGVAPAVFM
ncbi:MAG: hypothetical protein K8E66_08200, partial [Phycisphaerales bacterium]|nr:hypothetical protein [Phycisphaerales bacterium]